MVFFPRARSRSRMRCWAARSSLTGTTSWFEATAAELPFVLRCCHRRTTEGETASSRANSESVSYWRTTRAICSCLNCVVKKRRPSDPRRCVSIRRPSVEKSNYPSQTASSNWGTEHPPVRGLSRRDRWSGALGEGAHARAHAHPPGCRSRHPQRGGGSHLRPPERRRRSGGRSATGKTASHIRKRWRAHRNGVSVHMHPSVWCALRYL